MFPAWHVTAGAEYVVPRGLDSGLCVGAEWWPVVFFGLRAGAAGLASDDSVRISAGLTVSVRMLSLDYAFSTHPLGSANRVSLSYAFGRSKEPGSGERRSDASAPSMPPAGGNASPALVAATTPTATQISEPQAVAEPVTVPQPVEKINIAVAEFSAQGVSASDAAVIADILRNELVKTGGFKVIEKQNMERILAEQAFQQSGCTTEECAVRLGKLLNIQRIIVGSFGKLMDKYLVNLRVVSVETGEIIFGDSVGGRSVEEMETGLKGVAARIAVQVR